MLLELVSVTSVRSLYALKLTMFIGSDLDQANYYREQCDQVSFQEAVVPEYLVLLHPNFRITQGKHPLVQQVVDDL